MSEIINKLKQFKASKGDKDAEEMEQAIKEAIEQLQEKDKIIDVMAEVLNDFDYDKQCESCPTNICSASVDETGYTKCIIEYFTKKAREV